MRSLIQPIEPALQPANRRKILALIAAIIGIALGVFAFSTYLDYRKHVDATVDEVRNLAQTLAGHAAQTFHSVSMALASIYQTHLALRPPEPDAPLGGYARHELFETLTVLADSLPQVHAILMLDAKGDVAASSENLGEQPPNCADRDFFRAHMDDDGFAMRIGAPLRNEPDGQWLMPVSRRLNNAERGFAGVVVAKISLSYFERFYKALAVGEGDVIALHSADGVLLARRPAADSMIGRSIGESPMFRRIVSELPEGTTDSLAMFDGVDRVASYMSVGRLPLMVVVGIDRAAALMAWWSTARWQILVLVAVLPALVLCGLVIVRQFCRQEQLTVSLARSEAAAENQLAQISAIYAAAPVGLCFVDRDLRCISVNDRLVELGGGASGARESRSLAEVVPALAGVIEPIARDVLAKRSQVHDLEVRSAAPDEGGEARDWLLSLYPLPDKRGEILGVNIVAEDVTERLRAEDEIRRLANHDGLTGLPNRRLFLDRLQQALAVAQRQEGHRVAVMLLDLDHFKDVNDSLGHPVGDQLLCAVAGRLQTVLRASDTLARLGGDEFAVIQSGLQRSYGAAVLAQKLIDALAVPFRIDGNEIHTGTSVGISVYRDDGDEPEALVQRADMALYEAKEGGRARFRFFVPAMNEAATARKQLEADLRLALRNGELELVYQPQIDLANGALVAAEALLRWNHPERGVVQPASFIAVAEASGLIRPLGRWVLHEACAQARRWQESGNATVVSVNLSSAQLRHDELLTAVDEALDRSGLQPGSLALELDESLFTEPSDDVIERCLRGLAERGVQLTVDDFGTGSSSLAYLRRFPIDRIKIDRSFILDIGRNADAEAVIRAIIALGHSLGKRVVAEGVETDRQLAFLKGERCDEAQGFLLARPQSAGQVGELLAA